MENYGKVGVIAFETSRQAAIMTVGKIDVGVALDLLGLNNDISLTTDQIVQTSKACRDELKKIANLYGEASIKSPVIKNLLKAEEVLTGFIKFKNFNLQELIDPIKAKIMGLYTTPLSQTVAFVDLSILLKKTDSELKLLIKSAVVDFANITNSMILDRFGAKRWNTHHYEVETTMQILITNYWDCVSTKIDELIYKTETLIDQTNSLNHITSKQIDAIKQMCTLIEEANGLLGKINGNETEDSLLIEKDKIDGKKIKLNACLAQLKKIESQQEQRIIASVQKIVVLSKSIAVVPSTTDNTDRNSAIKNKLAIQKNVTEALAWLKQLNEHEASLAEIEFRKNILSQPTCEQVAKTLAGALAKLSAELHAQAMQTILGTTYNKGLPVDILLTRFFKSKEQKGERFQDAVAVIIESLNQRDIPFKANAKELVPAATVMNTESATRSLEEFNASVPDAIKKLSEQLNTNLKQTIEALLVKYKETAPSFDFIRKNKNVLGFAWAEPMQVLLQQQKEFSEAYTGFTTKIPTDLVGKSYLDSATQQLIVRLNQTRAEFEERYTVAKESHEQIAAATLKYTRLKERICKEKSVYEAKGTHDKSRTESLACLIALISTLDENTNDTPIITRFSTLLEKLHLEEIRTAASHKKIGFFGAWRNCRLQKVYLKIINEFDTDNQFSSVTVTTNDSIAHQKRVDSAKPRSGCCSF